MALCSIYSVIPHSVQYFFEIKDSEALEENSIFSVS